MKKIVVGILAHVDAGKTTLSESMLYLSGSIKKMGRVDHKDAFLDTYELERARGITIFSKQANFMLGDTQIMLLDTPGHVDFSADMERTLQVLDYAILVISGADGVQGHTQTLWKLLKQYKIPSFVFVNKMDQKVADKEVLFSELKKRLSDGCIDFMNTFNSESFKESIAMCDDKLLDKYLKTDTIEQNDIAKMILARKIFPCYFGSALKLEGVERFLDGMEKYMEYPTFSKEFGAKVFKISRDEQGNRLTHMKITGGILKVKASIVNKTITEKVNQIRIYSGTKFETVNEACGGTVCAVTGLTNTYAGEGLGIESASENPFLKPVLTYKVQLPPTSDTTTMLIKLRQLEEEEPQLHVVWNEVLKEIQVQLMGEVQIDVLKNLILNRFGIEVEFGAGNILYKETILETVEGVGHFEPLKHYAEVHLLLEPGEWGSGLHFETNCSEEVLDGNWQRLILTHLREKTHKGILTGSDITDMKITLVAGQSHPKHTEGGDFRQATYRAVRQGLMQAKAVLLEPYYEFSLEVPSEMIGRAMSDIEKMYGKFQEPQLTGELSTITGYAPVVTMSGYQIDVNSYTKGRGRLFCEVMGYKPCHNQEEIVSCMSYDAEGDVENTAHSVFCTHGSGIIVKWNQVADYMHVDSGLGLLTTPKTMSDKAETLNRIYTGSLAEDKELEEIFKKTYGTNKVDKPERNAFRQNVSATKPESKVATMQWVKPEPIDEYLLVDGYNIVFAWDELNELSKVSIDGAREKLIGILCNYQAVKKCILILVFDAYKVSGFTGEVQEHNNIQVVYTKEAQTADQYIEKLAHEIGRKYNVTVATSDRLEQLIVFGQGCRLLSARELKEDVDMINLQIRKELGRHKLSKNNMENHFNKAQIEILKNMEGNQE